MCIYQLFLILDHIKSYVEKNTLKIRGNQCGAHEHQVARKGQAVVRGHRRRRGHQISSISCRLVLWEVLSQT